MRSTKRVLTGNLAAASANASLATSTETPSTSNRMRPGLTRATHNSGVPLPEPMRTSSGFFETGTPGTLHVAGECAPRRFDLARRHPFRLDCLQSILAERQIHGAGGDAVNAPLVRLAELGSHRLQHD